MGQSMKEGRVEKSQIKSLSDKLKPFCRASTKHSYGQLCLTTVIYLALWFICLFSLRWHYGLTLLLSIPTGLFLVRLFMIQHDCGHGSFLKSRKTQDQIGFFLGLLTLTPYHYWKKTHAMHHSQSGNLDSKQEGEITTLTKEQYLKLGSLQRFCYRIYRNPFFLLTVGSAFQFGIKHRFPWDTPRHWKAEWKSVWMTNIGLSLMVLTSCMLLGWQNFALIQLPITAMASATGIYLFYVQHQYEEAYFRRQEDWNYHDAALQGSSHLDLPTPFRWLTANIGLHHIHHLNHNIPNYKLSACFKANPDLISGKVIKFKDTFSLLKLSLWDEQNQRLISFRELELSR